VRERLAASETTWEGLHQMNAAISDELRNTKKALEKTSNDYLKLQGRNAELYREVRSLRAKVLRASGHRSRAVEAAVSKAAGEPKSQPNVSL
jgi:chromosome segregation ATPase